MISSHIRRNIPVVTPYVRVSLVRYLSKVPGDVPELKKSSVLTKRKTKVDEKAKSVDKRRTKKVETTTSAAGTIRATATTTKHYRQLPALPDHIANLPIADLYKSVGLTAPKPVTPSNHIVNFKIPDKYIKSRRVPPQQPPREKDLDIVSLLNSIARGEVKDKSGNLPQLSIDIEDEIIYSKRGPHPIKSSLSGMFELNPELNDIDDEYLWENLRMDGFPPFQKTPLGFKQWEIEQVERKRLEKLKSEEHDKKYAKLKAALENPKTFYKKVGGRTKVDRKLIKQYLKLKQEGKIPDEWRF
ncbi:hypothetical protein JA1_002236 [Spathaspora sp. JA1]|nr:hypothetical protein JA1_002236 [Spathaspora sp. JA1]